MEPKCLDVARRTTWPYGDLVQGDQSFDRCRGGTEFSGDLPECPVIVDVLLPQPLSGNDHTGTATRRGNCDTEFSHPSHNLLAANTSVCRDRANARVSVLREGGGGLSDDSLAHFAGRLQQRPVSAATLQQLVRAGACWFVDAEDALPETPPGPPLSWLDEPMPLHLQWHADANGQWSTRWSPVPPQGDGGELPQQTAWHVVSLVLLPQPHVVVRDAAGTLSVRPADVSAACE